MNYNIVTSPTSFEMVDFNENRKNVERYRNQTTLIAKNEYYDNTLAFGCIVGTCCCISCLCSVIGAVASLHGMFVYSAVFGFCSGFCSIGSLCNKVSDDTKKLSKKSVINEVTKKILYFSVKPEQMEKIIEYKIITEETAEKYVLLYNRKENLDEKFNSLNEEKENHAKSVLIKENCSFTQVEFLFNDISSNSQEELLKNQTYKNYIETKKNLEEKEKSILEELKIWEEDKDAFQIELRKELPFLEENDEDIDLSCYSLFCKNHP